MTRGSIGGDPGETSNVGIRERVFFARAGAALPRRAHSEITAPMLVRVWRADARAASRTASSRSSVVRITAS